MLVLALLMAFLAGFFVIANLWRLGSRGIVHRVADGDGLEVNQDGQIIRVRIANIDAPEWDQPFGRAARAQLAKLCPVGSIVELGWSRIDVYGRRVSRVRCSAGDAGNIMISAGLAHAISYSGAARQRRAVAGRLGLWSADGVVHPSDWRAQRSDNRLWSVTA